MLTKDRNPDRYLSLKEVSARLGNRSRSSIYRDIESGKLPKPFKFGRSLLWSESEFEASIQIYRSAAPPRSSRSKFRLSEVLARQKRSKHLSISEQNKRLSRVDFDKMVKDISRKRRVS